MNTNTNPISTNASVFNELLNTQFSCKRKNSEGKYEMVSTTIAESNYTRLPKTSELSESVKALVTNIEKVYSYMEVAATATTDNQRDKAVNKAHDYARAYLKSVGISVGIGNISVLTGAFAPKKQTSKGIFKGGYTTKTTFVKYVLFLTQHYNTFGSWCDAKKSATTSSSTAKTIKSFDDLVDIYINNFGFSEETARSLAEKAREAKAEVGKVA